MAKPFSALPGIIEMRTRQVNDGLTNLVRQGASAAGAAAVRGTRVDTGKARSNWIASVNIPVTTTIPPYAAGNKLGISETGNAQGAINQHKNALTTYSALRGDTIFISNNVPYIGILNFGGPNIAPGNMLGLARIAFSAALKGRRVLK